MKKLLLLLAIIPAIFSCHKQDNVKQFPDIASIVQATTGYFETEAIVGAVGREAFVITDDTGAILVYHAPGNLRFISQEMFLSLKPDTPPPSLIRIQSLALFQVAMPSSTTLLT